VSGPRRFEGTQDLHFEELNGPGWVTDGLLKMTEFGSVEMLGVSQRHGVTSQET